MTRRRNYYRELFFAHNPPEPYACWFCLGDVLFDDVTVHHLDHDHENNALDNLAAAHVPCHSRHHFNEIKPWTYERTPEHRAHMSKVKTGQRFTHTEEAKAKIRAAAANRKPRVHSEETKKKMSETHKKRWEQKRRENQ